MFSFALRATWHHLFYGAAQCLQRAQDSQQLSEVQSDWQWSHTVPVEMNTNAPPLVQLKQHSGSSNNIQQQQHDMAQHYVHDCSCAFIDWHAIPHCSYVLVLIDWVWFVHVCSAWCRASRSGCKHQRYASRLKKRSSPQPSLSSCSRPSLKV